MQKYSDDLTFKMVMDGDGFFSPWLQQATYDSYMTCIDMYFLGDMEELDEISGCYFCDSGRVARLEPERSPRSCSI